MPSNKATFLEFIDLLQCCLDKRISAAVIAQIIKYVISFFRDARVSGSRA